MIMLYLLRCLDSLPRSEPLILHLQLRPSNACTPLVKLLREGIQLAPFENTRLHPGDVGS